MNEVCPLKSLEEIYEAKDELCVNNFSVPLTARSPSKNPKTLACHDFKGGYLEDRLNFGCHKSDCYNFVHWSFIDIFVYFSHNLVTIPPYGWISAAHRNGTLILGTFITEWENGAEICKTFLKDMSSIESVCDGLVAIAIKWDFDGWLINIENKIEASDVRCLIEFVNLLTKKMHAVKTYSQVIWYDSVVESGELEWQNSLNDLNRVFFDNCDGIFLNYNWTEKHLKESLIAAGSRQIDVYVGVDVFGRGCPGGGGFNTNIAMKALRNYGFSAAIFAPVWVYQVLGSKCFWDNQYKFWSLLKDHCYIQPIMTLPFCTTFCPGYGTKMYRKGIIIDEKPWFNLSLQNIQPSFLHDKSELNDECIILTSEDSYDGGGCLKLMCSNNFYDGPKQLYRFKILQTAMAITENLLINFIFKCPSNQTAALNLSMEKYGKTFSLLLIDSNFPLKRNPAAGEPNRVLYSDSNFNTESVNYDWNSVYFCLSENYKGCVIKNIIIEIRNTGKEYCSNFSALIGKLEIISAPNANTKLSIVPVSEQLVENDEILIKCDLCWLYNKDIRYWDIYYEINNGEHYIGTTSLNFFHVKLQLNRKLFCLNGIHFHVYSQSSSFAFVDQQKFSGFLEMKLIEELK